MPRKRTTEFGSDFTAAGAAPAKKAAPIRRSGATSKKLAGEASPAPAVSFDPVSAHEEIARLAYSYWEARGRKGGSAEEDWRRAENEYRRRRSPAH